MPPPVGGEAEDPLHQLTCGSPARGVCPDGDTAVNSASAAKGQATKTGGGKEEVRHDLRDGDYQIIIHVIEARDLKPVDTENGTADPVVVAKLEFPSSVIPAYQNTDAKNSTLNPVWDYTMIFKNPNLPVRQPPRTQAATAALGS